jgi:muramoyltetrapeptide carboxypeptidase LdcA involved in peptidoglycan recycling
LFSAPSEYTYREYTHYADGYLDWSKQDNIGKLNELKPADGWRWLQGNTRVQGRLFGGCIEVLEFMKGTAYWPEPSFWEGKILFFETSEEKPTPSQVKYMLRNYGMQGVYDKVQGILFGRARDYTRDEKKQLDETLVDIVANEFKRPDIAIVTNVDFGHTDPQIIMPLGVLAEIDCQAKTFKLLESPLR